MAAQRSGPKGLYLKTLGYFNCQEEYPGCYDTRHHKLKLAGQLTSRRSAIRTLVFCALLTPGSRTPSFQPAPLTPQPNPNSPGPLRVQANAALDQHDYPTALKLLTTLTTQNPTDAHLLYDLAFTQESLRPPAAAETYRRAIIADPKFFKPHLALSLLLAR